MAVGFSAASFGRSLLWLRATRVGRPLSARRVVRLFAAARARWPEGRLLRSGLGLRWEVPFVRADGVRVWLTGVVWSWGADGYAESHPRWFRVLWAARWRVVDYLASVRCCLSWPVYARDCDTLEVRPTVRGFLRTLFCAVAGRPVIW